MLSTKTSTSAYDNVPEVGIIFRRLPPNVLHYSGMVESGDDQKQCNNLVTSTEHVINWWKNGIVRPGRVFLPAAKVQTVARAQLWVSIGPQSKSPNTNSRTQLLQKLKQEYSFSFFFLSVEESKNSKHRERNLTSQHLTPFSITSWRT